MSLRTNSQASPQTAYIQPAPQTRQVDATDSPAPQTGTGAQGAEAPPPNAYGNDQDTSAKPQTYQQTQGDWQMPAVSSSQGAAPETLQLVDFEDDGGSSFDPGVQALQKLVHEQETENFEAMAKDGDESAAGIQGNAPDDVRGPSSSAHAGTDLKDFNSDDPAINELMSKIRDADNKNFKAMIDMIQQSLDRAKQMMEQNMKDYYQKVLPQMQAVEAQVKRMKSAEESGDRAQVQAAANQVGNLTQKLQQALTQNPEFAANPAAKTAVAALAVVTQGTTRTSAP